MAQCAPSGPGVSPRAVLLGLACCLAIAVGEPYGVLILRASPLAADFSTGGALFLFFLLTLFINPAAHLLTGSRLRRGELVTVYVMMIVAAAIPSWGLAMSLIPLLGGFAYYASPENNWGELITPHLPKWLVADDPEAIWKLFEGRGRYESIPWDAWLQPLLAWGLFAVTIYFITLCLLVVLRKQWVERERLLFPLAALPLEMSASEEGKSMPGFFRNHLMWVGFSIPALINSINALHSYYVFIPRIDLNPYIPVLSNSVNFGGLMRFEVIGLSYLLSLDVSLAVWLLPFLMLLALGIQRQVGWSIGPTQPYSSPSPPDLAQLAIGGLFFLVFSSFWNSRAHLGEVLRKAFGSAPEIDDSDELLSYRTAVFGLCAGFALALWWLYLAGLNIPTALVFLLSALVIFTGLARIVCQTGVAYARSPVAVPVFTGNVLGGSVIGPTGLAGLGLNFGWSGDLRTFVMASVATGLKLAEVSRIESRRLFWAILAAILVSMVGSFWAVIKLAYTYGGINTSSWQFGRMTSYIAHWITHSIDNPEAHISYLAFAALGAVLMAILTYIKSHFIGFPVHPVGLALGLTHPSGAVWFSVFIAWLLKAIILKYGGANLYRLLRPFFLGMVLGAFGSAGLWLVIDAFTGMSGNRFTLP